MKNSNLHIWRGPRLVIAVVLFAGLVMGMTGQALAAGGALYVSPTGSDSGICFKSAPCQTIGYAISKANPHNKIEVASGTYSEMVTITENLDIEGRSATIDASGQDNGVLIQGSAASGASVRGFTIENATFEGILARNTSNVTIEKNVLQHNDQGAFSLNPPGSCAAQGPVPGDCGEGLHLWAVSHSRVANNVVSDNLGGILLTDETGPTFDNQIVGNTVTGNAEDCGITMASHNPDAASDPTSGGIYGNHVTNNVSQANGGAGVGMFAAPPGGATYGNHVVGNTIKDNGEGGVNIHSHSPGQNLSGNVIANNTISGNGTDPDSGSMHPNGMSFWSAVESQTVTVTGNTVSDEYYGIFTSGPITIHGLSSNHIDSSVTIPVGP